MKYTDQKIIDWLKTAKRNDICSFLTCEVCGKPVSNRTKHRIQQTIAPCKQNKTNYVFCSSSCSATLNPLYNPIVSLPCAVCGKITNRQSNQHKKSKSGNIYCSHTCSVNYQNSHKTVGTRRSKLEVWLEQELPKLYPTLLIQFNRKDAINSELDIYISSLKLAFELNGIFHYEPIYGEDKLKSIQNNDDRKFQACLECGIELCIIDSSKQKGFTERSSKSYLDIITKIINSKLLVNDVNHCATETIVQVV